MTERSLPQAGSDNYRWVVCALLCAATSINYLDRQVLAILAPTLQREIGWNERQYGHIVTAFQAAYAIGYLGFGRFIDSRGTKLGYGLAVGIWSFAACGHAWVRSALGFGLARFGLGLGEGGNFPAAIKAISEWFEPKDRALATGIFNCGSNLGAIFAPLSVPWLALRYGWQSAFIVLGALGFGWLVVWSWLYRAGPLGTAQRARRSRSTSEVRWVTAINCRQSWVFIVGIALSAPIFWFYLYWTPKFLFHQFGVELAQVGGPLVLIYSLSTVGSLAGGWLAGRFLRSGWSLNAARKTALLLCALCTVPVILVPEAKHLDTAVWLIGLAAAGHMGWAANLFTIVSDLFPANAVATVVGVGGALSAVSAVVFAEHAGYVLETSGNYWRLFAVASATYVTALLIMHLLSPRYLPWRAPTASDPSS